MGWVANVLRMLVELTKRLNRMHFDGRDINDNCIAP